MNKENNGNVLTGKKWAVCGDSFTNGDFNGGESERFTDGKYVGQYKTYDYLIADRNGMEIQHLAVGGQTMAMPAVPGEFKNAFSHEIYKKIDSDADYITLYFGINDSHHRPKATGSDGEDQTGIITLGEIDDDTNSTFYGAWNVVLRYLISNHPYAHIGILVSNGCETDDYRRATIEIAKKWGIPYIDLNGDERTPAMHRSTNPDISQEVKDMRMKAFRVGEKNSHPNIKAHLYESWFIEGFLRSL